MSARAAWRLETLGFTQVYRYEPGKSDWLANGMPVEGKWATVPRAGDVARRDVPACHLGEHIGDVRERGRAAGWDSCLVVTEGKVVLGRLRKEALAGDGTAVVDDVMEAGPTTIRPDELLESLVPRLQERRVRTIVVTLPNGQLIGVVFREDAERRLEGFRAGASRRDQPGRRAADDADMQSVGPRVQNVRDSPNPREGADLAEVRWASRVNPSMIRRLYETDARGIVDEELVDEVGYALFARCRSILQATEAHGGRVTCPRCAAVVVRATSQAWVGKDEIITCDSCGWSVCWGDYLRSYQGKHLVGGGATEMHRTYVDEFARARSPREKMLAIDRLIHTFHWELVSQPGRSAARELIYARNTTELLTFLDRLTYGEQSTPGLRDKKAEWDRKVSNPAWHRPTGFRPSGRTESSSAQADGADPSG